MLGIGMGEMLLIAAIALIVFGPEKFPDFAKIFLRTIQDLRGYVEDIQKEVSKEIRPIKQELNKISYESEKYMRTMSRDLSKTSYTAKEAIGSGSDPTDRQTMDSTYTEETVVQGTNSQVGENMEQPNDNTEHSDADIPPGGLQLNSSHEHDRNTFVSQTEDLNTSINSAEKYPD